MPVTREPETAAVRAGVDRDPTFGAVMPPLYLSTNYTFAGFDGKRQYDYSRFANPTRDLLAEALSELEGGAGTVVTSSGMSAIDLVLSMLKVGETVVAPHDCYGGTNRLLRGRQRKGAFYVEFVDQTDEGALASSLARRPRLLLLETPSNPLMRIVDIEAAADAAHAVGAQVVVDNTFLSPALQQPLRLGADFVVHSTTKYLNGHSDVIGGAVVSADKAAAEELGSWANCTGVTGSPYDAYLTLRGLKTLFARLERQQESAARIADLLSAHPKVMAVHYPGLPSHPGHLLAKRQQLGFGAMLSFELSGGIPALRTLLTGLKLFTLAESLGGVESLVAHPATMTHASMDPEERRLCGIGDDLLRLSIGLEHVDDLLADMTRALEGL